MVLNKKGIFFTSLAIVIISLFLISYTVYNEAVERKAVEKRISSMDGFLFSTEKDVSRRLYISAYRIIFLSEKKIVDSGDYLTNLDSVFQEAFFNGTFGNQQSEILQGTTFNDIQQSISQNAEHIGVNLTLSSPSFSAIQEDPWQIKVTLNARLFMKDKGNLASWNKTINFTTYVPIITFEDPLYYVSTNGLVINSITKTPYTFSSLDKSNLSLHIQNSYYIASSDAPSFFDRLQGINSANTNGIESIVNLPRLSQQGIPTYDKSTVDHIYFSTANPSPISNVAGTPSWFKIDSAHLSNYGA